MIKSLKAGEAAKRERPIQLTKTLMNQYKASLEDQGYKQQTISMYFCYLNRLYAFLPGKKELTDEKLNEWISDLKSRDYSDRTINLHLSAVNGLMKFCGYKDKSVSVIAIPRSAEMPELTRDEYLKLLSYAKKKHLDRDYMLIKTLGTINIDVADLACLTVESCKKGTVELPNNKEVILPDCLQQELIAYVRENGPDTGPVFVSKYGNPLDRSNITHLIEKLGSEARIDKRKCNPSSLRRLYRRTQEEINRRLMSQHMQVYEQLLEEEQAKINLQ